jgi:PAS domain-containing protein
MISDTVIILLSMLASISAFIMLLKWILMKEIAYLGSAIPRLIIAIMAILYLYYPGLAIPSVFIHFGMIVVFASDVISGASRLLTHSQREEATKKLIDSLTHKFNIATGQSLVPFFTINANTGVVEYANSRLCTVLGFTCEELEGKNLFEIIDKCSLTCFVRTANGFEKALIIGEKTRNGHETITGSIYIHY